MAEPGGDVVENLIIAIEAMGVPEAVAAMDELNVAVGELGASVEGLAGKMDAAAASVGEAGAAGSAAGGKGLLGKLTSFKMLLAGFGTFEALKGFANFTSQMERLRTQTGATQAEVAAMSKGVLDMAVSVGTGPQSLAQALYHIESAGIRGQSALDALRVAAQGAKIGGAELTDTTAAMTAVMVAGFKGITNLRQAMGQLNAVVGAGDMTMQDLNDALGTGLLATVKTLGLQVKDAGAALAVLGDNNIRGAQAATRLRMGLMMLVKPSESATSTLRKIGLGQLQLAEDLRKPNGLLVMLEDLHRHLRGLSPTQQASDLASIFGGGRNSAAMLTLIGQMDRLRDKYAEVAKGGRSFNADWRATTRTLAFFGDQLKTLAEVALVRFGGAISWVVDGVKGLGSAFEHGKVWAVLFVGAIAGVAAVAAIDAAIGMIGRLGAAITGLFATGEEAGTLALLASGPWGWVIIGVTLLATLVLAVKPLRQAFVDTFRWIAQAGSAVFNWFKDHWRLLLPILFGPFGLAVDFITKHWHAIVEGAKTLVGVLSSIFRPLFSVLAAPFTALWTVVKTIAVAIVHAFSWVVGQAGHLLGKALGPLGGLAHLAGSLLGGAGHLFGGVSSFLGLASGTPMVTQSGGFVVGERGPEIVYLPRGAAVQPNVLPSSPDAPRFTLEATVISVLDGRQVARSLMKRGLEAQSCR